MAKIWQGAADSLAGQALPEAERAEVQRELEKAIGEGPDNGENVDPDLARMVERGIGLSEQRDDPAEQTASEIMDQIGPRIGKAEQDKPTAQDERNLREILGEVEERKLSGPEETIISDMESLIKQLNGEELTDDERSVVDNVESLIAELRAGHDAAKRRKAIVGKASKPFVAFIENTKENTKALKSICQGVEWELPSAGKYAPTETDREAIAKAREIESLSNVEGLAEAVEIACKHTRRNRDVIAKFAGHTSGGRDRAEAWSQPELNELMGKRSNARAPSDFAHAGIRVLAAEIFGGDRV